MCSCVSMIMSNSQAMHQLDGSSEFGWERNRTFLLLHKSHCIFIPCDIDTYAYSKHLIGKVFLPPIKLVITMFNLFRYTKSLVHRQALKLSFITNKKHCLIQMQSTEGKTIRSTKWNAQRKEHSVTAFSQPFFLCIAHSIHIYIYVTEKLITILL